MEYLHKPVLLKESIEALNIRPDGISVDGTLGRAGHSKEIAQRLTTGRLICIDRDGAAIDAAKERLAPWLDRVTLVRGNFSELAEILKSCGVSAADGLLFDLGVSSPQLDDAARGFSYMHDAPLDMRMDTTRGQSVAEWLQEAETQQIAEVIRDFGEERFAGPIAKAIVARREAGSPVATTADLAELVAGTVKTREAGQNPATRTFQALRIFINAELEELEQALEASLRVLAPGGRLVVISFHSLEDRIVKQFIAKHSKEVFDRRAPFAAPKPMLLKALDRIKPSDAEVAANPRARSAVMRVAERTEVAA